MNSNINEAAPRFSPRAGLVALAHNWQSLDLFGSVAQQVEIKQKTVKYIPLAKLQTAFLAILAGSR